jgi:hypothetical protein
MKTLFERMSEAQRDDPFVNETKEGIFRNHSCSKCDDGEKPCAQGNPNRCEYPHARND